MTQLITFNTRCHNIIDFFATTRPSSYCQPIRLTSPGRSDHAGFFIPTTSGSSRVPSPKKVPSRDFPQKNHTIFHRFLLQVNWNDLLVCDSVDSSISALNDIEGFLFDLCFPSKVVRLRSTEPLWLTPLTPFLKLLFNRMDYAFFHRRSQYVAARVEYLRQVSIAKARFSRSLFDGANSPRSRWKAINKLSNRVRAKSDISDQLADDLNRNFASSFVPSDINEYKVPSFLPSSFRPLVSPSLRFSKN